MPVPTSRAAVEKLRQPYTLAPPALRAKERCRGGERANRTLREACYRHPHLYAHSSAAMSSALDQALYTYNHYLDPSLLLVV